jgi:hypothetical protein
VATLTHRQLGEPGVALGWQKHRSFGSPAEAPSQGSVRFATLGPERVSSANKDMGMRIVLCIEILPLLAQDWHMKNFKFNLN